MKKSGGKAVRYNKWGYIFLIPFIVVYVVFQLVPLITTIYNSFFENYMSGLTQIGPNFVGFENYEKLFTSGDIWQYFKNTMVLWIMCFIPQIFLSLGSIFSIPLATGTIKNMVSRFAGSLSGTYERIRQQMITLGLIHCDETGTRADGKTCWVHNASNAAYTFLSIHEKRGWIGMNEAGLLPFYHGIIVHDCWGSYWKYENVTHSICCAHHLRELNGVAENHPEQTWAPRFKEFLLAMKKAKEETVASGKDSMSCDQLEMFDKQYDEIIKTAYAENPLPETTDKKRGRKKKGKVLNLIGRLDKYKASVCLFIKNFCVPFDNNQAERDIRMVKVKTKVSGCFRSMEGAQEYLTIMSYIGTARKHGINPYEAIRSGLSGNPDIIFG